MPASASATRGVRAASLSSAATTSTSLTCVRTLSPAPRPCPRLPSLPPADPAPQKRTHTASRSNLADVTDRDLF